MPTYATWNPADKGANITLSGGNLVSEYGGGSDGDYQSVRSTIAVSNGKWYWEVSCTVAQTLDYIGIMNAAAVLTAAIGSNVNGWSYYSGNGKKFTNSIFTTYGNTYTTGNVIQIALDMDNGKIWFGKNGEWQASGDPAAGTNEAFSGLSGDIYAASTCVKSGGVSDEWTANFGASAFAHSVPAGFNSGLYTSAETYEETADANFSLHDVVDAMNLSDTADASFSLHDVMEAYTLTGVLASTAFSLHDLIDAEIGLYDDTADASFSLSDFIDATLGKESDRYRNFLNYTGKHIGLKFQNAVASSPLYLEDLKMWIARTRQEAGYTKINAAGKHIGLKFQNNTVGESFYLEDAVLKSIKSETR